MDTVLNSNTFAVLGIIFTIIGIVASLFEYSRFIKRSRRKTELEKLKLEIVARQEMMNTMTEILAKISIDDKSSIEVAEQLEKLKKSINEQDQIFEKLNQIQTKNAG